MIVLVATTIGLVIWLVAWAFGVKAFDAFLITGALALGAAAVQMSLPFVKQILTGQPATPGDGQ